jgi:hypothetical protein
MGGIQCIKCFVVAIIHRGLFCVAVAGFRGFLACLADVEEAGIICGTGVELLAISKENLRWTIAYERGRSVTG